MNTQRAPKYFGPYPQSPWPPAPHDPRERVLVTNLLNWEVRAYAETRARTLAARSFHVQLWKREAGVSVLTPSALTDNKYEVYSLQGTKVRLDSRAELSELIKREYDIAFPTEAEIQAVEHSMVPPAPQVRSVHWPWSE